MSNSAWCRSQPPERSLLLPWQRLPATALLHWMNKAVSKEEKMAVYMSQAAATVRQITTLARSGALCKTHLRLSPSAARVTFFFFFSQNQSIPQVSFFLLREQEKNRRVCILFLRKALGCCELLSVGKSKAENPRVSLSLWCPVT